MGLGQSTRLSPLRIHIKRAYLINPSFVGGFVSFNRAVVVDASHSRSIRKGSSLAVAIILRPSLRGSRLGNNSVEHQDCDRLRKLNR